MRKRFALFLIVAAAIWLPNLHRFYAPDLERTRATLLAAQMAAPDPSRMRAVNPEWDFMRRTYVVLALANRAIEATAERERLLAKIDELIGDTLRLEKEHGSRFFLMAYADRAPFVDPEARSVFVDGEILMMMAARDLVAPKYQAAARERARTIEAAMRRSPSLSAESYPDECWTFCNTTALAALAMLDRATGDDHSQIRAAWIAHAKEHLVDPRTGILVSSFTRDGRTLDGPEGSSIWMVAHNLLVVDDAFARDQYARARQALGASLFGFGWAREWPRGVLGRPDVDSGPIVPLLDASAGSSGLALLGARAFGDGAFERELFSSLELAGFPEGGRYRASNDVGDAVVLYTLSFGPLWSRVRAEGARASR